VIIEHECEQRYLTDDDYLGFILTPPTTWCPNPGTVPYQAHHTPGLTIHIHLCGDCAITAANTAFRTQTALYNAGL
jgi:hypothetical protein